MKFTGYIIATDRNESLALTLEWLGDSTVFEIFVHTNGASANVSADRAGVDQTRELTSAVFTFKISHSWFLCKNNFMICLASNLGIDITISTKFSWGTVV